MRTIVLVGLVGCSGVAAVGPDGGGELVVDAGGARADGGGCAAAPLGAPEEQWSWVPVPGAVCGDGSQAGFAINPTGRSREVVVYLMGGGGCYSQESCAGGMAANLDGYGPAELAQELGWFGAGGVFDRGAAGNPMRDATFVFVPYCTGDFHAGSRVAEYGVHHQGYANVAAYLERLRGPYCDAERVIVAGSSAGGFGAVFNFEQIAAAFPGVPIDLVDDSGPHMRPPAMSVAAQETLRGAWGAAANVPPGCAGCAEQWHAFWPYLAAAHPDARFSLVSSLHDYSIGTFFGMNPWSFEAGIEDLADSVLAPLPNVRVFYLPGNDHVWLGRSFSATQSTGTSLATFLSQQLDGSESWSDVRP